MNDDFEVEDEETFRITRHGLDFLMSWARAKAQIHELTADPNEDDLPEDVQVAYLLAMIVPPWYQIIEMNEQDDKRQG